MKTCRTCHKKKPRSDFYAKKGCAQGLTPDCKDCFKGAARDRYQATRATGPANRNDWDKEGRRCTSCDKRKPWDAFHRRAQGQNGRASRCKDCVNDASRDYRAADPQAYRETERTWRHRTGHHYRKRYGIDREERDAMAAAQGGRCAVCSRVPGKRLVVDHCHLCSAVRALLCDRCNLAMHALDEPGLLDLLLAYRDKHLTDGCR